LFEEILKTLKTIASQHQKELIIVILAIICMFAIFYMKNKKVTLSEVKNA